MNIPVMGCKILLKASAVTRAISLGSLEPFNSACRAACIALKIVAGIFEKALNAAFGACVDEDDLVSVLACGCGFG
jgi:hypothetical protein